MYINTHPSCLIFVALVLTFVHSVTSQPVQASKWIKTNQYEDLNSRGTWKVFEKEGEIPLSDPSRHGSHNLTPTWQSTNHDRPIEQETPSYPYTKSISSSGKPVVSLLVPASSEKTTDKINKHHTEHTNDKSEYKSELQKSTMHAIEADRQHRYDEVLRNMHVKNTFNQKHDTSLSLVPGRKISIFTYRFSIPTFGFQKKGLPGYALPSVFTTVIILLVMVWIAMITIGLIELGNYLCSRRSQAAAQNGNRDEEQAVEMDELVKMPFEPVLITAEEFHAKLLAADDNELLESISSGSESDSDSDDDYRIF